MIRIGLDPDLVAIGSLHLSWHGLFAMLAIAAGVWLSSRLSRAGGLAMDMFSSLAVWGIVGGIVGARLVHVVDFWSFYLAHPGGIIALWEGGLAIWGGILGGALAAAIYARIKGFSLSPYADHAAFGLLLAQAIGRIGDIINGEHFSKASGLPWAVVYTNPNSPGFGLPPSHPAVAYELLMDLAFLGVLWAVRRHIRAEGRLFLLYLMLYSAGRFLLSFLRLDSNTVALGLNQAQWISLGVLVGAAALFLVQVAHRRHKRLPVEAHPGAR
ncbi:MAG: prolipoprotein diacylglyceryl transferase [Chloroflexi bacterium]|nr:prolipoprotein diacylglyceryl transferase [Chloroflexota bacterium]